MKTIIKAEEIKSIRNKETLRDYCGQYYNLLCYDFENHCITLNYAAYLYFLPDTITSLVKIYHFGFPSDANMKINDIYTSVLHFLEDLELDCSNGYTEMVDVYIRVYEDHPLGELFRSVAESIINSDYNRTKFYIQNCVEDAEIRKVLSKSLNGHAADKTKINTKIFSMISDMLS